MCKHNTKTIIVIIVIIIAIIIIVIITIIVIIIIVIPQPSQLPIIFFGVVATSSGSHVRWQD